MFAGCRNVRRAVGFALAMAAALPAVAQSSAGSSRRSAADMRFARACEPGEKIIVSAVGDILPHTDLQIQSYASEIGFGSLWHKIVP